MSFCRRNNNLLRVSLSLADFVVLFSFALGREVLELLRDVAPLP